MGKICNFIITLINMFNNSNIVKFDNFSLSERPIKCEFEGCTRTYSNIHSRRQHYRRHHRGQTLPGQNIAYGVKKNKPRRKTSLPSPCIEEDDHIKTVDISAREKLKQNLLKQNSRRTSLETSQNIDLKNINNFDISSTLSLPEPVTRQSSLDSNDICIFNNESIRSEPFTKQPFLNDNEIDILNSDTIKYEEKLINHNLLNNICFKFDSLKFS